MAMVLLDVSLLLFSPLNLSIIYPKPARNLPIGGVALAMVMLFVKPKLSKQAKDIRSLPPLQRLKCMDWAGTIIFLGAFVCLYLALQWSGQTKPWRSSEVIGLFICFGLLLGLFAYT